MLGHFAGGIEGFQQVEGRRMFKAEKSVQGRYGWTWSVFLVMDLEKWKWKTHALDFNL